MIIPFYGEAKNKKTPCQGTLGASEGHASVLPRCRGDGLVEAGLLPEEVAGQPARGHDPCPAPVLLAAVPGSVGLARGLIAMNGKVVGTALAEVYCAVTLVWAIHFLPGRVDSLMYMIIRFYLRRAKALDVEACGCASRPYIPG